MRNILLTGWVLVVFTGANGLEAILHGENWPQWRGPTRDGRVAQVSWPADLKPASLKQLWRVELGPSYSGPIVGGDHVFVTETRDKAFEVVRCLHRDTGKQIWETNWKGAMRVPFFAASNGSWIRSTPSYSDGRLYVAGMREILQCLDSETGKIVWTVDFVEKFGAPLPTFGFVCSPLVVGDFLYTQAAGAVVKIDKHAGQVVWRTFDDGGGMHGSAFSSPVWHAVHGQDQLVVQTRTTLAGLDPVEGTELWSQEIPAFRGMNIVTPAMAENSVFTSSYGGKSLQFAVSAEGDSFGIREEWSNKAQGYMSSPVVIDGHVYLHLRNQRFACIDLATGETKWTTTPFGKYWSMIVNDDQILALDQEGELLLIRATPKQFDLIDTRKISDEETWGHLAISGKQLFVRELNAITAFTWE